MSTPTATPSHSPHRPTGRCRSTPSPPARPHSPTTAATLVAVQIERTGLGISSRCTPQACGPFLKRLIGATAAQDTWNAFLASHTTGAVRSISIQSLVCHNAASPCNDRLPDGSLARPDGTHYAPAAAPTIAQAVIDRAVAAAGLARGSVLNRI